MKKKRKAKKGPIIVLLLILILAIFGSLNAFSDVFKKEIEEDKPTELDKEEINRTVTFTFAGNVLINDRMWYDTSTEDNTYDFKYVFEDLKTTMKKSNINFYSQQSILGGKELGISYYSNYNSPIDLGEAMVDIGFNMISLANYHAYDKGITGIMNSLDFWDKNNVVYSGTSISEEKRNSNNIITKNNIKIGLLAYTMGTDTVFNESYEINVYDKEIVKSDVETLKEKTDIIIVSMDWGNTGLFEVNSTQKEIANYLSELGVDIVVGNTGYSIQPIEKINNTLILYSLGNLLSGHILADSRISAVVDLKLNMSIKDDVKTIQFSDINVLLTYAYNNDTMNYRVIPFNKLTNQLYNYQEYYDKYKEVLTRNIANINIYKIGEENGDTKQES